MIHGVGGDLSRGDAVDVDPVFGPFIGKRHDQFADARLAGGIAGNVDPALESQQRAGEDDLTGFALDHFLAELARQHELRGKIGFDVWTNSNWAKWIQDPASDAGKVVQLNTFHNAWAVYWKINNLPGYNSPVRYDAYVRVRVIPQPGVSNKVPAFTCGVWLAKSDYRSRTVRLNECSQDSYRYVKIAENFPVTLEGSAWIAPMKNEKTIKEIRIDHFLFVRRDDEQAEK